MTTLIQIETNTYCNHKCWFCQNSHYPVRPPAVMSMCDFSNLIDAVLDYHFESSELLISFANYNEPTFDPLFMERLRVLSSRKLAYWFISNGTNMHDQLIAYLLAEGQSIRRYHFNIPAIEPDAYHKATGGDPAVILEAMERLHRFLEKLNAPEVVTGIIVHGDFGKQHRENFEMVERFFKDCGITITMQPVMNRAGMLSDVVDQFVDHKTSNLDCSARYLQNLYIGVEGNVYLCCHDYFQVTSYGSLLESTLEELLQSKDRDAALLKLRNRFCRYCPYARPIDPSPSSACMMGRA